MTENLPRALLLLAAIFMASCSKSDAAAAGTKKAPVRVYRVTATTITAKPLVYALDATGSLEPFQVVTVPARVEGALDRLDFDVGSKVTPATVLAVVDERRYALVVEQAKAAVLEAEAALGEVRAAQASAAARTARMKAELDDAEAAVLRWTALRAKDAGYVSEEKMQAVQVAAKTARAGLDEAAAGEREVESRMRQAAATVEARKAAVAIAAKNVEDTRVVPPIAGIVEKRHVAAGQYVKVGEPIATLVDTSRLRLRFPVGEAESVQLKIGQSVAFRVKAAPDREFKAELFHIGATADSTSRMVDCLATIADPDPALHPGFFAQVHAEVARAEAALVVPEGALLPTEKGFVAFVVENGHAVQRILSLGLHTREGAVEVLSGLKDGERVVLSGAQSLQDGVAVEVVDEAAKQ